MGIDVKCKEIKNIPINLLVEHPQNQDIHPKSESLIERLRKIFKSKQGFNKPLKVNSNKNINKAMGIDENLYIVAAGHARLEALKLEGEATAPCTPIDYENQDFLISDLIADNAANEWREVNKSAVNAILPEIGDIDFDIDILGIDNFEIEPMDKYEEIKEKELDENIETENECPKCGYKW